MTFYRRDRYAVPQRYLSPYLDVQSREVAVEVLGVVDVGFGARRTHHVPDVFVSDSDGEMLLKALAAN